MGVPIKVIMGVFVALGVALAGIVALLISYSFAMTTIRSIGRDHATEMLRTADAKVSAFFDLAVAHAQETQEMVLTDTWKIPVDAAAGGNSLWYLPYTRHIVRTHRVFNWTFYTMTAMFFVDGSWIDIINDKSYTGTDGLYVQIVTKTPGRATVPSMSILTTKGDYPVVPEYLDYTSVIDTLALPSAFTDRTPCSAKLFSPPGFSGTEDQGLAVLVSNMCNATGARIGSFIQIFSLSQIGAFLRSLTLVTSSQAFLIDSLNMVVATSHPTIPTRFLGPANATTTLAPNCYIDTSLLSPVVVCRTTAATFPYAPLQQLHAESPSLLNTSSTERTEVAQLVKLSSGTYYVAVDFLGCSERAGLNWKFVMIIPESGITGNVNKGRNIAIATVACVCVLISLAIIVVVALVLRPLQRVSDRMYLASELNDNEADDPVSVLSEVALLQDSYTNLRAKLNEMKAFVPQALLQGNDGTEDVENEWTAGEEAIKVMPHRNSEHSLNQPSVGDAPVDKIEECSMGSGPKRCKSVHSIVEVETKSSGAVETPKDSQFSKPDLVKAEGTCASRNSDGSKRSGDNPIGKTNRVGLNVATSLVKRNVAVLTVNIRGFHESLQSLSTSAGLELCERAAHVVFAEAREQRGVVALYHGDRFLITFNAATTASSPAKRAAITALKIRDALTKVHLRSTCGIAFGPALCGNTGSTELKSFSCIGTVVAQSAAMERIAKMFCERYGDLGGKDGAVSIIATGSCLADVECYVYHQVIDYVAAPQVMDILGIMGLKKSKDDEWMYQLRATETADAFACVNTGFHWLHSGDVAAAKSALDRRTCQGDSAARDAVGAAQLEEKLQHIGTLCIPFHSGGPSLEKKEGLQLPLSDFGPFFSSLF